MALDFDKKYRVNSWNTAVAVYPVEYKEDSREEWVFIGNDDADRDDDANWDLQVDWITDETMVYVIMVGDDARHLVDVEDLVVIEDAEYCSECGQIGCGWGA